MRTVLASLAIAAAVLMPVPLEAASRATVRVTGNIPLRDGPGGNYSIVARLADGERVHLERCTRQSNWCLVVVDGRPAGWARGSYLVGWPAKIEVSPPDFSFNPFGSFDFPRHRPHDDDDD